MAASTALIPIFLLIMLGYGLKWLDFLGTAFWPALEKLTYFLLFPALLISSLATAPLQTLTVAPLIAALIIAMGVMAALTWSLRGLFGSDGAAFSSVFQGSVRFNTYVGLAVAAALYPTQGLTLAALAVAVLIPLVNVLCVLVLSHSASPHPTSWRTIGVAMGQNPLILACLVGVALNLSTLPIPSAIHHTISLLGRAALPLGLLAVGAALQFNILHGQLTALVISSGLKLVIFPLLTGSVCGFLQVDTAATVIAVLFSALPTAPSAYMLARQMGGDAGLMANLITLQTLLAAITLPLVLILVSSE